VGPRAGLDGRGKSRPPTGIRSPDLQVRSESLYRLSYPGPPLKFTSIFRRLLAVNLELRGGPEETPHWNMIRWAGEK